MMANQFWITEKKRLKPVRFQDGIVLKINWNDSRDGSLTVLKDQNGFRQAVWTLFSITL